jgi:hypothetical protein
MGLRGSSFSARDEFNQTAGALTGKTAPVGGTWTGGGDTDDFTLDTANHYATRAVVSDTSRRINGLATPALASVVAQVDFYHSVRAVGLRQGLVARLTTTLPACARGEARLPAQMRAAVLDGRLLLDGA